MLPGKATEQNRDSVPLLARECTFHRALKMPDSAKASFRTQASALFIDQARNLKFSIRLRQIRHSDLHMPVGGDGMSRSAD
jgi:hypothetical protein